MTCFESSARGKTCPVLCISAFRLFFYRRTIHVPDPVYEAGSTCMNTNSISAFESRDILSCLTNFNAISKSDFCD